MISISYTTVARKPLGHIKTEGGYDAVSWTRPGDFQTGRYFKVTATSAGSSNPL